ncbi:homoserine kinase [Nocardioides daejeonensis]|uniref:homoserine kinase n=1 Tax=Nocardioides daejeonensis TaxID=1046556 RepID=UPI000D741EF6|nr:homoserine kinase [Nocardioides daejeonensis]
MSEFVAGAVHVRVPATSANLGPGFDTLGLALELYDDLVAEVVPEGLQVEVTGAGAGEVPLDETHLVIRSMRLAFDAMGVEPSGLRVRCTNRIPHARGLGSSSAAIVGGIGLARALVVDGVERLSDDGILQLAASEEGHPDNVAPAVGGGFVVAGQDGEGFYSVASPVHPAVTAVAFIPPHPLSTEVARGLLPATVPHSDAATNAGRAALLVAAMSVHPERLLTATADLLHQDYRETGMPASLALMRALRADGHAATISGAGPTVLVLTTSDAVEALLARCPEGWQAQHLAIASGGVHQVR